MTIAVPTVPKTIEETGVASEILQKLIAKLLHVHGTLTPSEIAREIRLPIGVVALLLKELQRTQMIEAKGLAGADMRSEVRYALGGGGFELVANAKSQSEYIGPAPVPLTAWVTQIRAQSIAGDFVSREALQKALSHLVLPENIVDLVGPAVNSARSVLLYGEPGNGKTSIAQAMGEAFSQEIYVPYCVEVGGQFINLFDPNIHTPTDVEDRSATAEYDRRWRRCRRPCIITGGELSLEMLDLSFNPTARFYEAPLHAKAIGGVFIVDDFGRQRTDPQSVLNRWIVPLESKFDFLTLHTGQKFSIPFDQLVIFSTNIEPSKLADAGGLRRLYYKILVPSPTKADFAEIFNDAAIRAGVEVDSGLFEAFFAEFYGKGKSVPAGHHPRYILDFARSVCAFRDEPPRIDMDLLKRGFANLNAHN